MIRLFSIFLLVLSLMACGEQPLRVFEKKPAAPELVLDYLDGSDFQLSEWKGKPVVVNFWASWCPPCREEIPSMNRAWDILQMKGVKMIGVNYGEDAETVNRFLAKTPVNFPIALDPDEQKSKRWPVVGLPITFILDAEGRVVYSASGPREWDAPDVIQKISALSQ